MDVITEKHKPLGWYFNLSEMKTNLTNLNKLTLMDILQLLTVLLPGVFRDQWGGQELAVRPVSTCLD